MRHKTAMLHSKQLRQISESGDACVASNYDDNDARACAHKKKLDFIIIRVVLGGAAFNPKVKKHSNANICGWICCTICSEMKEIY